MNTAFLTQGFSVANSLRKQLANNRDDKKRKEYDQLRAAAQEISELRARTAKLADGHAKDSIRQGLAQAGPVTQGAHLRLEALKKDLDGGFNKFIQQADETSDEARKQFVQWWNPFKKKAKKTSKRVQRQAEKAAQEVTERLNAKEAKKAAKKTAKTIERKVTGKEARRKRVWRGLGIGALVVALIAAVAGGLAGFNRNRSQNKEPEYATPPSVKDVNKSTVVYSTSTEDAGDLAEEPAERDEELLESLDEQLRVNREAANPAAESATEDKA